MPFHSDFLQSFTISGRTWNYHLALASTHSLTYSSRGYFEAMHIILWYISIITELKYVMGFYSQYINGNDKDIDFQFWIDKRFLLCNSLWPRKRIYSFYKCQHFRQAYYSFLMVHSLNISHCICRQLHQASSRPLCWL